MKRLIPSSAAVRLSGVALLLGLGLLWSWRADAATLRVEGVSGDLKENVTEYLGKPPEGGNTAALALYVSRAQSEVKRALESMGYYRPKIEVKQTKGEEGPVVLVSVDPGRAVRLERVHVDIRGAAADDDAFQSLRKSLPLVTGDVLNHGNYQSAKQAIRNLALDRGYFDGRFVTHRVEVDTIAYEADVDLVYDSGPRYRFGATSFSSSPFRESLLERFLPFHQGDPYLSDDIAQLNRRLLDSGYFSDVSVRTNRDAGKDHEVPVDVELKAKDPNQVGFGLGFSTDVGPRVRISWDKPWLNSLGHALYNELQVSKVEQSLSSRYRIPLNNPVSDYLQLQAGYLSQSFADTQTEQYTLGVQFDKLLESDWHRALFVRWQQDRFTQGNDEGRTTLVLPGASYRRTRSRGGLNPSWGDHQSFTVEFSEPFVGSDIDLIRVLGTTKWLRTLGTRHQFIFRLTGGALAASDFEQVPSTLRFFAGGDQSVRGYGYQRLAPKQDGKFVGGRYLATGSVEYDYRVLEHWSGALFVDAGNAFNAPNPPIHVGSGFGVRWLSPVGPVRLDFAWALDEPGKPMRLHFSMGPPL